MAETKDHSSELAAGDMKRYARAMRSNLPATAISIEKYWGLFGYPPEIVSTVLAAVATGLPLDAAIEEATS